MNRPIASDPLEDTKMSFGEHLEELRAALWKAVVAVFLGFLVGLLLGDDLIRMVQAPLTRALEQLEREQKQESYAEAGADERPSDDALGDRGLAPERFWIDSRALIEALRSLGVGVDPPETLPDSIELPLWSPPSDTQSIATGVLDPFNVYLKAS
ncbi:MAG: twin-arginine translocase subunit TatC, partial [Planctomycetota bacterium]